MKATPEMDGKPSGLAMLWLLVPTVVVAIAMVGQRNGWLAMFAFHGTMIAVLIVHRRKLDWGKLFRPPPAKTILVHLGLALIATTAFSWAMYAYANRHDGYGSHLDSELQYHSIPAVTRIWFALQLCLLNPLLEEMFWRGLFFTDRKKPAATDFCYAAFHFYALLPFMPAAQSGVATIGLVGIGYFLRQLARRQDRSLVLPLVWHVLGDVAVVVAIARLTG